MNTETLGGDEIPGNAMFEDAIDRRDTGLRLLSTLLFAVIWGVVETALAVVVVFSLVWALIARQGPPPRLRELANRLVAYAYRIWRYLTYNEARVPFPFSEFPAALERPGELGPDAAEEVRELLMDTAPDTDEDRD